MQVLSTTTHSDKRLTALLRVQDDVIAWASAVTEMAFYGSRTTPPDPPQSFGLWMRAAQMEGIIRPKRITALEAEFDALCTAGRALLQETLKTGPGRPPPREAYQAFGAALEPVRAQLRTLVKISVLEDHGIDHITGLYSPNAMHECLKIEMDRLARRGHSFTIALARIDRYGEIASHLGEEGERQAMRAVAKAVRGTLRVYDDGYRAALGEFVLCLKQADIHAGNAAMDRLHGAVAGAGVSFDLPGGAAPLTLTSCLVAPLPGDTFEEILGALRHDLKTAEQEPGAVLTHHETSPLERMVQEDKDRA